MCFFQNVLEWLPSLRFGARNGVWPHPYLFVSALSRARLGETLLGQSARWFLPRDRGLLLPSSHGGTLVHYTSIPCGPAGGWPLWKFLRFCESSCAFNRHFNLVASRCSRLTSKEFPSRERIQVGWPLCHSSQNSQLTYIVLGRLFFYPQVNVNIKNIILQSRRPAWVGLAWWNSWNAH
jgi:hypothetical protein